MLLEEWLNMESSFGELGDVGLVQPKLPKKLKKRRPIASEDGLAGYVITLLFYHNDLKTVKLSFFILLHDANLVLLVFKFLICGLVGLRYWLHKGRKRE